MRTFIAIDLAPALKDRLLELVVALKRTRADVKWSDARGMHLTLKFLGEVDPGRVADITAAVWRVAIDGTRSPVKLTNARSDGLRGASAAAADGEPRRFLDLAGSFGTDHDAFARHLRRQAAATVYDERAEAVPLMTLHAAKGLEFPVVFLAGLEEGLLPCTLMGSCDLEEERRLLYVGLTRAREQLLLTGAATRPWGGTHERQPSRFLAEIPEHLVVRADAGPVKKSKKGPDGAQLELF